MGKKHLQMATFSLINRYGSCWMVRGHCNQQTSIQPLIFADLSKHFEIEAFVESCSSLIIWILKTDIYCMLSSWWHCHKHALANSLPITRTLELIVSDCKWAHNSLWSCNSWSLGIISRVSVTVSEGDHAWVCRGMVGGPPFLRLFLVYFARCLVGTNWARITTSQEASFSLYLWETWTCGTSRNNASVFRDWKPKQCCQNFHVFPLSWHIHLPTNYKTALCAGTVVIHYAVYVDWPTTPFVSSTFLVLVWYVRVSLDIKMHLAAVKFLPYSSRVWL